MFVFIYIEKKCLYEFNINKKCLFLYLLSICFIYLKKIKVDLSLNMKKMFFLFLMYRMINIDVLNVLLKL